MGMLGRGAGMAKSAMENKNARALSGKVLHGMGRPTMRQALGRADNRTASQITRSGMRRAGMVGGALGINAILGPSGSRSTGGTGSTNPRSSGGYA